MRPVETKKDRRVADVFRPTTQSVSQAKGKQKIESMEIEEEDSVPQIKISTNDLW